jgi:hypothetical protein
MGADIFGWCPWELLMGRPKKPLNNPVQINVKTEERLRNIARTAHLNDSELWELGLKTKLGVHTLYNDEIVKSLIKCEQQKITDAEDRIALLVEQLKKLGGIYGE